MARDNVNVKINIDTKKAEKSVAEVLVEMEHLNQEIDEAKRSGDEKMLAGLQSEFNVLEGSISNSTKTLGNLSNRLEYLQDSIQNVEVGTDEFKRLQAEIKQTDGNLRTVEESLEGMSFNDAASMASQLAGGIGDVAGSMMLLGGASEETMAEMQESLNKGIGIMMGITGAIDIAEVASRSFKTSMKALNKVIAANPIGAIAIAAAALATATYFLVKRLKEQNAEYGVSNEHMAEFNTSVITQKRELRLLYDAIKDTTVGTEDRTEAVSDLQDAYPDYITNIDLEKASVDEVTEAYSDSITMMRAAAAEKFKAKQLAEAMEKPMKKIGELQVKMNEDFKEAVRDSTDYTGSLEKMAYTYSNTYIGALQAGESHWSALRKTNAALEEDFKKLGVSFNKAGYEGIEYLGVQWEITKAMDDYFEGPVHMGDAGLSKLQKLVVEINEIQKAYDGMYDYIINPPSGADQLGLGLGAIEDINERIAAQLKKITESSKEQLRINGEAMGDQLDALKVEKEYLKSLVYGIKVQEEIIVETKKSLAERQKGLQVLYEFEKDLIEKTVEDEEEKNKQLYELELKNLEDKLALLEEYAKADGELSDEEAKAIKTAKDNIEELKEARKAATEEQVIGLNEAKKALKKNYEYEKDLIERTVVDEKEKNKELEELELKWLQDKLKLANKFAKENGKLSEAEAQRIRDLRAEVKTLEDEIGGDVVDDIGDDEICEGEIEKELSCEEKKIEKINELKIHAAREAAAAITEILGRANQRQLEDEQHAIDEKYNKEIDRINEMAEAGTISQEEKERQLEDAAEKKEERDLEIKIKQFEYDKKMSLIQVAIQTALSIIEASPNPFAMIAAGITGAAAAATILATKPPTYALGGLVEGDEHEQGGTLIEAEQGEAILNKQSMANPAYRQLASQINVAGGGVPISPTTSINQNGNSLLAATVDNNSLEKIVKQVVSGISQIPVTVTETDITERQRQVQVIENKVTF